MTNEPIEPMEYKHHQQESIAVFELKGSLLSETDRDNIKKDFTRYIDDGVVHFLIDLSELKHVNSTGLGIFISLYTKVRNKGGELVINNPTENIANLLKITKLDNVFQITATQHDALQRLTANHAG